MSQSRNQFHSKAVSGAFMHSMQYFLASSKDVVMQNPNFKNPALHNPAADPNGIAMYCVHGTADLNGSFRKLAYGLLDSACKPKLSDTISGIHLLSFRQRGRGKSIKFFAEDLRAKININGHKHVTLMGHSRGGLVAAYYAEHFAALDGVTVHGAVLINSPVRGAMLAMRPLSYISESVREMETNSQFTNALSARIIKANKQKKYYFVASRNDSIVHPEFSYLKENCHSLYLDPNHGHLSVMRSTRLIGHLASCINAMADRFFKSFAVPADSVALSPEERASELARKPKPQTLRMIHSTLFYEIDEELERLKKEMHLFSCSAKKRALTQLQKSIAVRLAVTPIGAASFGDVIVQALQEVELKSGRQLHDLIVEPLNGIFSLLKSTPPQSRTFLVNLIRKYNSIPIPQDVLQVDVTLAVEEKKQEHRSPSPK
jgi:pimeloyl-ACP methyl ester carboxylesterase